MRFISKAIFLLFLLITTGNCFAGYVGGPDIVFVNLAESDGEKIDLIIGKIVHNENTMCWNQDESYIYKKIRPPIITNELVRKVFLKNDIAALKILNKALKKYSDKLVNGFDGIIVYADSARPRMMSLTTGRQKIKTDYVLNVGDITSVEESFCNVMPDVVRKP